MKRLMAVSVLRGILSWAPPGAGLGMGYEPGRLTWEGTPGEEEKPGAGKNRCRPCLVSTQMSHDCWRSSGATAELCHPKKERAGGPSGPKCLLVVG